MAHLGLGAFHRSHQAWYTQRANEATAGDGWGIASFGSRSRELADALRTQDGVYTLLERSADGDAATVIESITATGLAGGDAWVEVIANADVEVLTVTVTEAGYVTGALPPARIAAGLAARRRSGGGALSIVSCDNLLGNGQALRPAVLAAAGDDAGWVVENVSFVDTVVDRITPAVTDDDVRAVRTLTGADDRVPVVCEPFSEWVIADTFAAGRPAWESAGAVIAADVTPYEERKLWLLNAGHTFLAAAGRLAGYATVDQAFADPALRAETEALWAEQRVTIDLAADDVDAWLEQLRTRFDNPRISHRLEQIARGSEHKIGPRLLVPLRARERAGLAAGDAQLNAIDTWVRSIVELTPPDDAAAALATDLRTHSSASQRTEVLRRFAAEGD
ncbi:mannitol dehydrogenase family protein [Microbacterium sp. ZW T5_56]|uniref:mannitol dehydrogenase family protein n=1 Tax=Microbacterium sp. ZW T5_56 TaxID=3378081 RepID=UPI003851C5AC